MEWTLTSSKSSTGLLLVRVFFKVPIYEDPMHVKPSSPSENSSIPRESIVPQELNPLNG